jgi:hypothetical protein
VTQGAFTDPPREQGFADVFGAAVGAGVGSWFDADAPVTALLVIAGTAVGLALSDWWLWLRGFGTLWREASLERFRRKVQRELDRSEERRL